MKNGLVTSIQILDSVIKRKGTTQEAKAEIERRLSEYYKTIQIAENNGTFFAMRGNFASFSSSVYGVGSSVELATADLLWKETTSDH